MHGKEELGGTDKIAGKGLGGLARQLGETGVGREELGERGWCTK